MTSTIVSMRDAAEARRVNVRARADRPQQRRNQEQPGGRARLYAGLHDVQLREADDGKHLDFEGIASATEQPYEMYDFWGPYTEIVSAGAFAVTLNRSDLDTTLVLGHDQLRRIARTTNGSLVLEETGDGLHVRAPELDPDDQDVAYIAPKLRAGLVNEMSFAFRITAGSWSPDYMEYRINEVDIHRGDVSIVGYGANPHTTAALRTAAAGMSRAAADLLIF